MMPTNNSPYPNKRTKHLIESKSTEAQQDTEYECAPFFVDLKSLSESQLDHLRSVGLLGNLCVAVDDGSIAPQGLSAKAAKLLGVNETEQQIDDDNNDGDIRQRVELLEEIRPSSAKNNVVGDQDPYAIRLVRSAHIDYLSNALSEPLSRGFISLDASHPWMIYWCLHSLDLLRYFDPPSNTTDMSLGNGGLNDLETLQKSQLLKRIVSTLKHCWTDMPLEFDGDDVKNNAKLTQLHKIQQEEGISSSAAEETSEKITIIGGGFGGGPQQMPHCAPTYAAVLSLCIIASIGCGQETTMNNSHNPHHEAGKLAMELLNEKRLPLYAFFLTLREHEDEERTAFRMHHDGEIDVRASYCILTPCHLLGLLDKEQEKNHLLSPSIARYIASCQTFEGGFGAEPFNEAHGGYTFCALAALRILDSVSMVDVDALRSWLVRRQMEFEGGFCGRTNKLVDGCYSFWQGGAIAVLDGWYNENNAAGEKIGNVDDEGLSFDEVMLQRYILLCAQDVNGGLRDKPSKPKDFYHSCYNLSGLSVAQHALCSWPPASCEARNDDNHLNCLFGDSSFNILARTDPVLNIRVDRVMYVNEKF
jgi:protein farnesyltransferase subunit beta